MSNPSRRPAIDSHLHRPWLERHAGAARRTCAWPGCCAEGEHRAPRSREELRDFIWLCLEHVREYNRGWDYFAGMSEAEIESHRRDDTTWHRPSWRFGTSFASGTGGWSDPFGFFEAERTEDARMHRTRTPAGEAEAMMAVLELQAGFSLEDLKKRYKLLVKRHHPDLHGGDRDAEERLKRINEAYKYLKDNLVGR
ncbi:J domain-containing protein [Geminicoccaceae bacterium 1502E]|nr:J domain-containing protein [Geminicoccaceae bacterium 1502E]